MLHETKSECNVRWQPFLQTGCRARRRDRRRCSARACLLRRHQHRDRRLEKRWYREGSVSLVPARRCCSGAGRWAESRPGVLSGGTPAHAAKHSATRAAETGAIQIAMQFPIAERGLRVRYQRLPGEHESQQISGHRDHLVRAQRGSSAGWYAQTAPALFRSSRHVSEPPRNGEAACGSRAANPARQQRCERCDARRQRLGCSKSAPHDSRRVAFFDRRRPARKRRWIVVVGSPKAALRMNIRRREKGSKQSRNSICGIRVHCTRT